MNTPNPDQQTAQEPTAPREESPERLPSVAELAHLAAVLAQGRPIASLDFAAIAGQALELWTACSHEIESRNTEPALIEEARALDVSMLLQVPNPKAYPVAFDDFLRLALPKKRVEDRAKVCREYILEYAAANGNPPVIEALKNRGFDESQYPSCLLQLRGFASLYDLRKLMLRAQAGGKAKAEKRKARPPVEKLKAALLT